MQCLYPLVASLLSKHMELVIDGKTLSIPSGHKSVTDIFAAAHRLSPPMIVIPHPPCAQFSLPKRIFLVCENGVRVECKNKQELLFACKLVSEEHNRWQIGRDYNREWLEETAWMEEQASAIDAGANDDDSSSGVEDGVVLVSDMKWKKRVGCT